MHKLYKLFYIVCSTILPLTLAYANEYIHGVSWQRSKPVTFVEFSTLPPKNASHIIVLRVDNKQQDEQIKVRIDGHYLSSLNINRFISEVVCPGIHKITISKTKDDVFKKHSLLITKANKNTFILINHDNLSIEEIPFSQAKQLFQQKKLELQTHHISRVNSQCKNGSLDPIKAPNVYFLFDFAKYNLRQADNKALHAIGSFMQLHKKQNVLLIGHTDSIATEKFNLALSKNRAKTVKYHLIHNYNIDPKRIKTTGFGESKPIATNKTLEGRQQNRRVELQFSTSLNVAK